MPTPTIPAPIEGISSRLHRTLYRRSGGRRGGTVGANKRPVALLATTGRRSSMEREWPVIHLRDAERIIVVAPNGGRDHDPAWYLDRRANPNCSLQLGGERTPVVAREADAGERAELWPRLTAMYSGYADYAAKTTRVLPVVVLEPEGSPMIAQRHRARSRRRTLADVFFRYGRAIYDWMYRRGAPWEGSIKDDFVELLSSGRISPGNIGRRAIDIGCGIGDDSRLLARHGFDVLGVDLSPVAIERARSTSEPADAAPGFVTADLLDLPPEVHGPFDLLVDIGTLDDFPRSRRPEAVDVITSLARPGSILYLWCFYGRDRDLPPVSLQGASRYLAPGIEPDELRALFADGWDIEPVAGGSDRRWASFLMTRR